jgi:hypothetical protein
MTMNQPKNPNVFNFFGNECKDGNCVKGGAFSKFKDPKFISDKNFKEFNRTISANSDDLNILVDRKDGKQFPVPDSQKKEFTVFDLCSECFE